MHRRWYRSFLVIPVLIGLLLQNANMQVRAASGSTVVIGYNAFPGGMNPFLRYSVTDTFLKLLTYAGLTKLDPSTGLAAPDIAQSWDISPDGLVYTFHLRPSARFFDGHPVTSADVAFSWKIAERWKNQIYAFVPGTLTVIDAHTIRYTVPRPAPQLLTNLAWFGLPIVEKAAMSSIPLANWGKENWGTDYKILPMEAGPYLVTGVVKGDHYTLTANPYYWGGTPRIKTLIVKAVGSDAALFNQLQAGDIQGTTGLPAYLSVIDKSRFNVYSSLGTAVDYLAVNVARPYLADLKTRQALMYAIDRQGIDAAVYKGQADVVNSFVAPAYKAYYDANVPNKYPYNPAQAKAVLAAAGWKPGSGGILTRAGAPFNLSILFPSTDSLLKETATIIQQNLADVGIKVNLVGEDPTTLYADVAKGHFDLELSLDGPLYYPDISRFYECDQVAPAGYNFGHFCNAALDKIFEGEKYAVGLATQQRLFNQMQASLNQNLPGLWLNSPRFIWFMDKRIKGYAPGIFLYPSSAYKWYY